MSDTEWAPFECLFWNANDSDVKLMVSIACVACEPELVRKIC